MKKINQHWYGNYTNSSVVTISWVQIWKSGKNQQKHSLRLNWLCVEFTIEILCILWLLIMCYLSQISVTFIVNLHMRVYVHMGFYRGPAIFSQLTFMSTAPRVQVLSREAALSSSLRLFNSYSYFGLQLKSDFFKKSMADSFQCMTKPTTIL